MKLNNAVYFIFLFFFPAMVYAQGFNVPDFTDDKIGTYIPIILINELEKTNNYRNAMSINQDRYYDVLCINKNIVYSNLQFHDQYAIKPDDAALFVFNINNDIIELIDKNGYKYVKISNDTNYYRVYREYVNRYFKKLLNRFNQNTIITTENGFIYNGERWILNLDVLNYPHIDNNFMYFNENRNGEYIGIHILENEIILYSLRQDNYRFLAYENENIILKIK